MTSNLHSNSMTSSRPYIIRALHEWIVDNSLTPYLLVNAMDEDVRVPMEYVDGGKIVLNISPMAVDCLCLEKKHVEFRARFRGVDEHIYVPTRAIMAIYAKENGRGMAFEEEPYLEEAEDSFPQEETDTESSSSSGGKQQSATVTDIKSRKNHLKVVK